MAAISTDKAAITLLLVLSAALKVQGLCKHLLSIEFMLESMLNPFFWAVNSTIDNLAS